MRMNRTVVALSVAIVAQAACNASSTTSTSTGTTATIADSSFAAAITGTLTDSLTGPAVFQFIENTSGVDSMFAFSFGLGTQTGALVFVIATPAVPAPGVYALYPDTSTANPPASQYYVLGALGPTCSGCAPTGLLVEESGTLTITSASSTLVVGTFQINGFEIPASNTSTENSITITGGFEADSIAPTVDNITASGPCSLVECDQVAPYPNLARTASGGLLVSSSTIFSPGSVIRRAVKTLNPRAER